MNIVELRDRLNQIIDHNKMNPERNELPVYISIAPLARKYRQRHRPARHYRLKYACSGSCGMMDAQGNGHRFMELYTSEAEFIPSVGQK